jgi:hypothetical protein
VGVVDLAAGIVKVSVLNGWIGEAGYLFKVGEGIRSGGGL